MQVARQVARFETIPKETHVRGVKIEKHDGIESYRSLSTWNKWYLFRDYNKVNAIFWLTEKDVKKIKDYHTEKMGKFANLDVNCNTPEISFIGCSTIN